MKKIKVVLSGIVLIFSASVFGAPEIKGTPNEIREILYPKENIVVIRGHAEEKAYSNKAILSLVITTEHNNLSTSIKNNEKLRNKIKNELISAGIKAEEVNNSKFSTSPQYGWFGKEPDSYKVVNRMDIGIYDEKQLVSVAKISDENTEVVLAGAVYEHTEKEKYESLVKEKAVSNIMTQKGFYEDTLGIKLVPTGVSDIQIGHMPTDSAMLLDQALERRREKVSYSSAMQVEPATAQSSFDEVKYEANVVVEFKISK